MWKILKKVPKFWYQSKVCTPLSIGPSQEDAPDEKECELPTRTKSFCLYKRLLSKRAVSTEVPDSQKKNCLVKTSGKKFDAQAPNNYGASYNNDSIRLPFTFEALGLGFIFFLGLKHACISCLRYAEKKDERKNNCPGLSNFLFSIVWAVRGSISSQISYPLALPYKNNLKNDSKDKEKQCSTTESPLENAIPSASHLRASLVNLAQKYASLIINSDAEMCLKNKDLPKAVQYFREAAEMGLEIALFNLGVCYETGTGVQQNSEQAFRYYMESGNKGNNAGFYNVAVCYNEGIGVEVSEEECIKYMLKASEGGIKEAQTYMGIHYGNLDEYEKAADMFQKAVEQKHSEAEYFLGLCYEHGLGVEHNMTKAGELFTRSATSGNIEACYRLANYYEQGLGGMTENEEMALQLIHKAADGDHPLAIERLKMDKISENNAKVSMKRSSSSEFHYVVHEKSNVPKSLSTSSFFDRSFIKDLIEEFKIGKTGIYSPKFYLEEDNEINSKEMINNQLSNVSYNYPSNIWRSNESFSNLVNV